MALPPPFGTAQKVSLVFNPALAPKIEKLRQITRFGRMGVVLVDMSTMVSTADGTGVGFGLNSYWNADKTMYAASTVKVAAMIAAFRLLKNLQAALAAVKEVLPLDKTLERITTEWKPMVEKSVDGGRKDFPDLAKIFAFAGSPGAWTISFDQTFWDKMRLSVSWSEPAGSSYCILALGYQYIAGTMISEGLYSNDLGGIWLAGDYSKGADGKAEKKSGSHQAASALAFANCLALLQAGRLVGPWHSSEMRKLMLHSWMELELKAQGRAISGHFGKLGAGVDGTYDDVAVIDRPGPKGTVRYGLVMLGAQDQSHLLDLGRRLDDLVMAAHS